MKPGPRCIQFHLAYAAAVLLFIVAIPAPNGAQSPSHPNSPITGELILSSNHHYFFDEKGHAVLLAGSQTWNRLQDWGTDGENEDSVGNLVDLVTVRYGRIDVLYSNAGILLDGRDLLAEQYTGKRDYSRNHGHPE